MTASVIIATHTRVASLLRTLSALDQQTVSAMVEITVVDDGSDDDQRARQGAARSRFRPQPIERPHGGRAGTRSAVAAVATGDILCFLDDDMTPVPTRLEELPRPRLESDRAVAVLGAVPFADAASRTPLTWHPARIRQFEAFERPAAVGAPPRVPPLYDKAPVRRNLSRTAGGYDESFRDYGGEDLELGYRPARSGVEIVCNAQAVGRHAFLKDLGQYGQEQHSECAAVVQLCTKHPEVKAAWKVDVVAGPLAAQPSGRKLLRRSWLLARSCPWLLLPARLLIAIFGRCYWLRMLPSPFYRWVSQYHYARGIEDALQRQPEAKSR